jgi:hypothetical protein
MIDSRVFFYQVLSSEGELSDEAHDKSRGNVLPRYLVVVVSLVELLSLLFSVCVNVVVMEPSKKIVAPYSSSSSSFGNKRNIHVCILSTATKGRSIDGRTRVHRIYLQFLTPFFYYYYIFQHFFVV